MNMQPLLANRKELFFGWRYLAFQSVFLGSLLRIAAGWLGITLTGAQLNGLFFAINFTAVVIAFRDFLRRTALDALEKLPRILLTALVGFFLYRGVSRLLNLLILQIDPNFANVNDQSIISITQEGFSLMAIGTVLLVPLTEEILHRTVVFGTLLPRNKIVAYAVSTALFSLVHITGYANSVPMGTLALCFLQYVPAGLCLAASYHISGSVLAPVLIHTAVNAIAIFSLR